MKILGFTFGECSSAALMVDGKIVACVSQERFSRKKNDERYPKDAIEYCLKMAGIKGSDLDQVTIASEMADVWHVLTRFYSTFSIQDYVKEQYDYWKPIFYEGKKIAWHELYKNRWDLDQYPGRAKWEKLLSDLGEDYYLDDETNKKVNAFLIQTASEHIGIDQKKIQFIEHHSGHAAYAYYASPFRGEKVLVLTTDAFGDGYSATISIAENDRLERIKSISHKDFQLGRIYRYITLLLGMKANEHEYKVMGLAPYAKPEIYKRAYEVFNSTMYVDGLDFKYHNRPTDMYFWFKERLEGLRFDGIAGGLQKFTEEILTQWVSNAVKATGVKKVVFSGGVSMNVKAMKEIAALPEVEDLFVPPSGGDESLCMGTLYHICAKQFGKTPLPLENSYLGPDILKEDVAAVVQRVRTENRPYKIVENVTPEQVATQLAAGRVIGRAAGRMEFGARALGNRSIMADARSREMVQVINEKIKNRDFWMPFAPAMLADKSSQYVKNPKNLRAPYMTVAFDSTDLGWKSMAAGAHPADRTARPQFVSETSNPGFAAIIREFEKKTGVAVVMNTSFNLHGEPIVSTAADAYRVFELTSIDDLVIGDVMLSK